MEPSLISIFFWRIAVQWLYPYSYMNSDIQEVLGADYSYWVKSYQERFEELNLLLIRETIKNLMVSVLLIETLDFMRRGIML
ncbi:maker229 [Drosophila busckii]|uniref:Maker229 n=1 Tax=Drosophila busckii TaxID=30019 RepID=A0A0M4EGC4_DROBS|nr:uncharacterized protein LOC108602712 [Drosophila busckii]ALC47391.1 maker229 [Drosophila busckii]